MTGYGDPYQVEMGSIMLPSNEEDQLVELSFELSFDRGFDRGLSLRK